MGKHRVIYEVEEIRGTCPVYKNGDKIVFDSQYPAELINLKESDAVCVRAVENMWTHLIWQAGSDRIIDHMRGVNGECRIACAMPGEPYTPCGHVVFRIRRENLK
jgi:hypothetical protein